LDDFSDLVSKLAFLRALAPWAWGDGRVFARIASFWVQVDIL